MGDKGITVVDLFHAQQAINENTNAAMARTESALNLRIDDLHATQRAHGASIKAQGRELGELRTVIEERTKGHGALGMTIRQRHLLRGAVVSFLVFLADALHHAWTWLPAVFGAIKALVTRVHP